MNYDIMINLLWPDQFHFYFRNVCVVLNADTAEDHNFL